MSLVHEAGLAIGHCSRIFGQNSPTRRRLSTNNVCHSKSIVAKSVANRHSRLWTSVGGLPLERSCLGRWDLCGPSDGGIARAWPGVKPICQTCLHGCQSEYINLGKSQKGSKVKMQIETETKLPQVQRLLNRDGSIFWTDQGYVWLGRRKVRVKKHSLILFGIMKIKERKRKNILTSCLVRSFWPSLTIFWYGKEFENGLE